MFDEKRSYMVQASTVGVLERVCDGLLLFLFVNLPQNIHLC